MPRVKLVKLRQLVGDPDYTLLDNLTLFHARPLFDLAPTPANVFNQKAIADIAADPEQSAFLGLIEALILCEKCAVDHFTLEASSACQEVAMLFPDVVVSSHIEQRDRDEAYNSVLASVTDPKSRKLLEDERALIARDYYRTVVTSAKMDRRLATFAERYYDPTDRFKHAAIARGAYGPLNAIRAHFYVRLALKAAVPYSPHPWRAKLLSATVGQHGPTSVAIARHITGGIARVLEEIESNVVAVNQATAPPLAAAVLKRANEPKYVPEVVHDIRDSKRARRFRSWCKEFRQAVSEGQAGAAKVQKMWSAVQEAANKWKDDLDEEVRYRTRSIKVALGAPGAKADVEMAKIRDPILVVSQRIRPLLFLNDIFRWRETR